MGAPLRRARVLGALSAVLLVASVSACTWPGRSPRTTTTRPSGPGATGRYAQQVFTNIDQVASGVTYRPREPAAGYDADLKLDAWAPAGDTAEKRPAIVWAFGGAFIGGARSQMNSYAQDSARRGYVGITIDYRKKGQASRGLNGMNVGIVPAYLDAIAAGEWLRANAARYRIDPDAIVIGGFSAGGMTAINSVVLPGGPLNFPSDWNIPPGTVNPERSPYAAAISNSGAGAGAMATPQINVSRSGQAPIIMFAGTADTVVSYQRWQVKTCDDHRARGNVCELVTYQGAGHGVFGQMSDLYNRSAAFVKEHVLLPKGYPAS